MRCEVISLQSWGQLPTKLGSTPYKVGVNSLQSWGQLVIEALQNWG
jgi:hypothetical protein